MSTPAAQVPSRVQRPAKRKVRVVSGVLAVVLCLAVAVTRGSPTTADSLTLAASADSYTRADASTNNFGTSPRWSAQEIAGYNRHGLLRFNVVVPTDSTSPRRCCGRTPNRLLRGPA
jgi:hypothetical protein